MALIKRSSAMDWIRSVMSLADLPAIPPTCISPKAGKLDDATFTLMFKSVALLLRC